MTGLLQSLLFDRLSFTLVHFLWQGALIAAFVAATSVLLARRRPELRYAVSCAALVAMLALVSVTFVSWHPEAAGRPAPEISGPDAPTPAALPQPVQDPAAPMLSPESLRRLVASLRPFGPWIVLAWLTGVLALSTRLLYGWRQASSLVHLASPPAMPRLDDALARLSARLRVTRPVRLLESATVRVPMAIGTLRPVILLPVSAAVGLTPQQLEAILAHELAHIRRHDYVVNLLQTVAETLLFYHPAVWWVSRQVRAERENCCDDLAIEATGSARVYARALVGLEQMRGGIPETALAASGGHLWRRIARLFPQASASPDRTPAWAAGVLALAALGALGAMTEMMPDPPQETAAPAAPAPPQPSPPHAAQPAPAPPAPRAERRTPAPEALPGESVVGADEPEPTPAPSDPRAARLLTPEQLIAFRRHGVTPEFVRAVAAEGFDPISPDDLIAMRIHGVTPEFIRSMTQAFGRQPLETYVAFRIHSVTPEVVASFREAGYGKLSADDVLSARIHGVRPAEAAAWTALGFERPSLEDLVSLRIHGVDPEFARRMREGGFPSLSLDDLVAMKIHGVTPDFVEAFRKLGYTLSADEATSFRIHGVESDLVRAFQALGYENVEADDLVSLKIHGVTAEYARRQNQKAGKRIPLDELTEMRRKGVRP